METILLDRGADPDKVQAYLELEAKKEGLPFSKREKTYNSRLAQELGKWAETQGADELFHDAMFRTCFVDSKNIGDISVLVDLAGGLGLVEDRAKEVLETRAFKASVDQDWKRSQKMGIKVAPTMVFNEKKLVGAQKYEKMEEFMRANNAKVSEDGLVWTP